MNRADRWLNRFDRGRRFVRVIGSHVLFSAAIAEITQPRRWSLVVRNDNTRGLGASTWIIAVQAATAGNRIARCHCTRWGATVGQSNPGACSSSTLHSITRRADQRERTVANVVFAVSNAISSSRAYALEFRSTRSDGRNQERCMHGYPLDFAVGKSSTRISSNIHTGLDHWPR
ncbi:hypothetical protein Pla52n_01550 [Stieleria varia]|uniref:Uncharacterized protein n=1 Tax=Stieleria varia TaxID=2528005 RepID=A0A5C6B7L2_9BACT|nr:hypothetical protein Pla52n_01550 [Stieleria varia]